MEKNPKLKIEIEAVDRATKTLEEASKALRKLSSSFKQTAKAAQEAERKELSFLSTLKSGSHKAGKYLEKLDGRFKRLSSSIFNLKTAVATALGGLTLGKIVKDGIEFNAQLQTAKLGLSALITSSYQLRDAQGQVLSGMQAFTAAQQEAEKLYREILNSAMQTASTSRELLETFQAILPYAAQTGMSLEQSLNMAEAFVNAAKAIGLGLGQAAQEARALFMGDIDQNAQLLRALNISKEMVDTWKKQGRLYDEVMKKLQPFVQASQEFVNTWEGVTSSVADLISMLEGSIFKDTFRIMNEALKEVRDKLQEIINDEDKLNEISKEVANKFLDTAETIIVASDRVYRFGKTVYDFVNSHKEITEFGVLGYLLLGKKGALLGAIIGGIAEVAEKSKDAFPTTKQILKAQPNTKSVIGISPTTPQLTSAETFENFQRLKQGQSNAKSQSSPLELPVKSSEEPTTFANESLKFIQKLREKLNRPTEKKEEKFSIVNKPDIGGKEDLLQGLKSSNFTDDLIKAQSELLAESLSLSLTNKPKTIVERLAEKKDLFSTFSIAPLTAANLPLTDYTQDLKEIEQSQLERLAKYREETQKLYSEILKTTAPQKWKEQQLQQLQEWYEERKKVLGESIELQEIYEHKKLEIEKEAHEQEQKLYLEKLKQTSKWKAGIFKSLDDLSKKWVDTNQQIYDLTTQTFQALENSLETLFFDAMRGKLKSLGDYVNSFLASVESAIAGIAAQGVASSIVNFGKSILGFKAADGGVIEGHFIPLKAFATGGVVDRPTLGLVGEGKYPEAIVPLPDGRSIPVKFEGKGNQPINLEIVIVDDRSKIPPPQIGKEQIVLTVAEDIRNNGIIRKLIQLT